MTENKSFKEQIVDSISQKLNKTKTESSDIVNSYIEILINLIKNSPKGFRVDGLGTFEIRMTKAKEGRNPKTGQKINIPAKNKITFKASKNLKDEINKENCI